MKTLNLMTVNNTNIKVYPQETRGYFLGNIYMYDMI